MYFSCYIIEFGFEQSYRLYLQTGEIESGVSVSLLFVYIYTSRSTRGREDAVDLSGSFASEITIIRSTGES